MQSMGSKRVRHDWAPEQQSFLITPHGMWDLSSPTRLWAGTPGVGSAESLDHCTPREAPDSLQLAWKHLGAKSLYRGLCKSLYLPPSSRRKERWGLQVAYSHKQTLLHPKWILSVRYPRYEWCRKLKQNKTLLFLEFVECLLHFTRNSID